MAREVYTFGWAIAIGSILALIFDLFRVLRKNGKSRTLIVCVQDILFLIIATITIIASAFITNSGEIRGYMIAGYIIGYILYLLTLSKFVILVFGFIISKLQKIIKVIANMFINKIKPFLKKLFLNKEKNNKIQQDF